MPKVSEIFYIKRAPSLDLNAQEVVPKGGVNYVGCSAKPNGVTARIRNAPPQYVGTPGEITVALVGATLETFVQPEPFVCTQNVNILTPINPDMTLSEKLWWCMCIRHNAYRYSYGRKANRTFADIELPSEVPSWVHSTADGVINGYAEPLTSTLMSARDNVSVSAGNRVNDLFIVRYGQSLELNKLGRVVAPHGVNFVSRASTNNGVTARVQMDPAWTLGLPGEMTVALGGNGVLSTFIQPEPFVCGRDVAILEPRDKAMSDSEKLWWSRCIWENRYRYSYGRQANRSLGSLVLPELPSFAGSPRTTEHVVAEMRESLLQVTGEFPVHQNVSTPH